MAKEKNIVAALAACKVALEMHTRTTDLVDQCHSSFDLAAIEAANTVLNSVGAGNTTSVEHAAVAAQQQAQTAREELIKKALT
tara:strand:- start:94 stop:342 length:249 start_codon:yes stop_codon:yes gene_type:complete